MKYGMNGGISKFPFGIPIKGAPQRADIQWIVVSQEFYPFDFDRVLVKLHPIELEYGGVR